MHGASDADGLSMFNRPVGHRETGGVLSAIHGRPPTLVWGSPVLFQSRLCPLTEEGVFVHCGGQVHFVARVQFSVGEAEEMRILLA